MFRWGSLRNQRGSVTIAFLVYMTLFLFLFVLVLNLSKGWYGHSHSQASADAGSLAASRKVNEMMKREIRPAEVLEERIQARIPGYFDPDTCDAACARWNAVQEIIQREKIRDKVFDHQYDEIELPYLLLEVYRYDYRELGRKAYEILSGNSEELAAYVRQYVTLNGSEKHGRIEIPYTDYGRIRVITSTDLKPVWLQTMTPPEIPPVEGDGSGPDLGYLYKMPKLVIPF